MKGSVVPSNRELSRGGWELVWPVGVGRSLCKSGLHNIPVWVGTCSCCLLSLRQIRADPLSCQQTESCLFLTLNAVSKAFSK